MASQKPDPAPERSSRSASQTQTSTGGSGSAGVVKFLVGVAAAIVTVGLLVVIALTFGPYWWADGTTSTCPPSDTRGVGFTRPAMWKLVKPSTNTKVVIAFDDWVNETRRDSKTVRVQPTANNKKNLPLRGQAKVAAFPLEGFSNGERSLQFDPSVTATRSPDGRGIRVSVCATRSERREKAGRYRANVRIAAKRAIGVDMPVEVTVKSNRRNVLVLALLATALGVAVGYLNTRKAEIDENKPQDRSTRFLLRILELAPRLGGVVAGLSAAFVIYADDPTWGDQLGADASKLFAVTFAAAAGGLTLAAPPARAAQERLAR